MENPILHLAARIGVLALLAAGCIAPKLGGRVLGPIESFATRLAERRVLAVCLLAVAAVIVRVSLLRVLPVPVPTVHDEFSYLLQADTFAHGRLANPPHPMWIYFDTFHVNQHPFYVSIYPPAQGAILALGQLLGHPWIGVLLSMAAACAAVLWMLQGWLPPRWALLGGVLVLLHLAISSYWMNSYWGGAPAAVGGALAVGALPRILHSSRRRDAVILGIGTMILANSRPFEGFIFLIPVYLLLLTRLFGIRRSSSRFVLGRIVAPLCLVLFLCGAFILYYNKRTTGNPANFHYTNNVQSHFATPQFAWQRTRQPFYFSNPQLDAYYNKWWPSVAWSKGRPNSLAHTGSALTRNAELFVRFYLWPELCVPLIAVPCIIRDRRTRLLAVQWVICFVGFVMVAWFLPHYAAPLTATTFALVVQGFRHIRRWRVYDRLVGIGLSRAVVLCGVLIVGVHVYAGHSELAIGDRARIAERLHEMAGDQLVIVRYAPEHDPNQEWVYNRADIDQAKVVWAREIPGVPMRPLLDYFRGRKVWIIEPDSATPQLLPYSSGEERQHTVSSLNSSCR